ncbi:MAG: YraN family protein [Candidatus Wildermuthbacteria bacterium]|nr:YraN family protein [Candidatus Wildermuthbacteria bacterium]
MRHTEVGRRGEEIARIFLEERGYRIVKQNDKNRFGEIDIIALKNGVLVFVEVRTKSNEQFGTPEDTITRKKRSTLRKNALSYTARVRWKGPCSIDAVCIVLGEDGLASRVTHYAGFVS